MCHLIDVSPLEQKVCGHLERCGVIGVHLQRPLAELLCELELALVQQIRRLAQQLLQAVLGLLPLPSLLLVRLGALLGLRLAHALILLWREAETIISGDLSIFAVMFITKQDKTFTIDRGRVNYFTIE